MRRQLNFKYEMLSLSYSFLLRLKLDDDIVTELNEYLDELQKNKNKKSHAHTLVGQINQHNKSQQLLMDHNNDRCTNFREVCLAVAKQYLLRYNESSGNKVKGDRLPEMDEMWSVHSYEGDYNPLHSHGTKSLMGVSITTWTKVPKQIEEKGQLQPGQDLFNASGAHDGYLNFNYGISDIRDSERLKFSAYTPIKPEIGVLYVFPSWMQHSVYPFFGEGERRTVAANVNMWPVYMVNKAEAQHHGS